jgi:hypothetical protein
MWPQMIALISLLAYNREDVMVAALAALVVAALVVAIGAWLLFFRTVGRGAAANDPGGEDREP